jgi:hypothetical protein
MIPVWQALVNPLSQKTLGKFHPWLAWLSLAR